MLENFKTIICEGTDQLVEKKSRFIGYAFPVQDENEISLYISQIKKKHYDANHNVFAYQLGERNELTRQSDDGEPSGTAGLPVLDVLRGEDIKNTLIIVTRYFGGTLLGTGGLVRSYGKAAKLALLNAGIVEKTLCREIHVQTDYSLSGKIQYYAVQNNHVIQDTVYTDMVEFVVHVEHSLESIFVKAITELTNGSAVIVTGVLLYAIRT